MKLLIELFGVMTLYAAFLYAQVRCDFLVLT